MKTLHAKLSSQFVIPVIRETHESTLEHLVMALADGGLTTVEITLMSEAALKIIEKLSVKTELTIGAGTVLTPEQAQAAIDAGAKFLVSPGLNEESVKIAHRNSIPFIPGVLTPTEVMRAQALGCDTVKIFPVTQLGGASYLKALQGPFPQMKWMTTGGVQLSEIKTYLDAGCLCVGLGGQLLSPSLIKAHDWSELTKIAQDHIDVVKKARHS